MQKEAHRTDVSGDHPDAGEFICYGDIRSASDHSKYIVINIKNTFEHDPCHSNMENLISLARTRIAKLIL